MTNKYLYDAFKSLRVYKYLSWPLIINNIICNRIMKQKMIVDWSPKLYKWSQKFIGKQFTNFVLQSTYCKIFSAGNSIQQTEGIATYLRSQGILTIINYCAQGDINNPDLQNNLDKNAFYFGLSAKQASLFKNQMISIKITALLDIRIVKKWNQSIIFRNRFWQQCKKVNNSLFFNELFQGLKSLQPTISQKDVIQYLKVIHHYQGQKDSFSLSEVDFKINHHPYYLYQTNKNDNSIIKLFSKFQEDEIAKINSFQKRLINIMEFQHKVENNFRITVDAQQSYVQYGIESICQQMQVKYNKKRAYVLSTLQNYLKRSPQRTKYEIQLAKNKNIKFGAKLVRGAYIVQQTRLSKEFNYQNPVVPQFELTTQNYLGNFQEIIKNFKQGQLIAAGHNLNTVNSILQISKRYQTIPKVSFAQLLGLADHITYKLRSDGIKVYKCLPWAQTEVMVAYMIRRAQQLNQMRYPLDLQYQLLKHQIIERITFS